MAIQAEFLEEQLESLLEAAHRRQGHLFFVDVGHFVQGAFLCCLWCVCRLLIRGVSGRQCYSVLGAWNAVMNELVRITTAGTVSSDTMCDLLRQIAALGLSVPVTLVLENARYQHCRQKRLLAPFVKSGLQSPSLHEP